MKRVVATLGIIVATTIAILISRSNPTEPTDNISTDILEEKESTIMTEEVPEQNEEVKLRVSMNDQTYTVTMFDNPASKELVEQLPLTLDFVDYNGQEKGAKAPKQLSMEGVPESDRGHLNDFIYYKPSNSLVFCYTDIGEWNGIVRLGTFDTSIEGIKDLPDGFTVTIEKI